MKYIFDSNVPISSARFDLPFSHFRSFWDWLAEKTQEGVISFPEIVLTECGGTDYLHEWMQKNIAPYKIPKTSAMKHLPIVLQCYGKLETKDLEKIQNDAIIIAHAVELSTAEEEVAVVTYERVSNATSPGNKKIPTICSNLKIKWLSFPAFFWELLKAEMD